MNFKSVRLLIVPIVFLFSLSSHAGNSGGGGNVQQSTRADLEEVVGNIQRHLWEIADRSLFGKSFEITKTPLKPELSAITKTVFGTDFFTVSNSFYDYARNLQFKIADGPCRDGNEDTDSSTLFSKNSPICLSASRLSRFPKSALKNAILPLVFHEISHQFGFDETDANRLQALADLHLKYRTIYLSAYRAKMVCEGAILNPTITTYLMYCAARSNSTGENIENGYNGDLWAKLSAPSLSESEKQLLISYNKQSEKEFYVLTVIRALTEPTYTGTNESSQPLLIMKLGATAAIDLIDQEVGRVQNTIN